MGHDTVGQLRRIAREVAPRSHVPFSDRQGAAVALLGDGRWVPGVRVESASFSLVIPPALNALTTAAALGTPDVVAIVASRPFGAEDVVYLGGVIDADWVRVSDDAFVRRDAELPRPAEEASPFLPDPVPATPEEGIALARRIAARAVVPESQFPVGCVLVTEEGRLIPGVNVEHSDWSRILCAERNALGTALSYGVLDYRAMYLTCVQDVAGSPCGACRQLLSEWAFDVPLWIDRGDAPPELATPASLLPGGFTGNGLVRRR